MDKSLCKKKAKRKKTQNLGPCMKVSSVTPEANGLKVECQLESIQQKMVTFEFQTGDLSTDEISSAFVSSAPKLEEAII